MLAMSNPAKFNYSWWYWDSEICSFITLALNMLSLRQRVFLKLIFLKLYQIIGKYWCFSRGPNHSDDACTFKVKVKSSIRKRLHSKRCMNFLCLPNVMGQAGGLKYHLRYNGYNASIQLIFQNVNNKFQNI